VLKSIVERATKGSLVYSPLRDLYQLTFNRHHWNYRRRMLAFYGQFFPKNGLVFDVGANVGVYTEMFLKLGARVVAIEPNPKCVTALQRVWPSSRVAIEPVAVGQLEGEATLFLCDNDTLSTLSPEWIEVAHGTRRFGNKNWNEGRLARVTTLDGLASKYGRPDFIKIDVEGFERQVLSGLSKAPRYLSFEFNTEYVDAAVECVSSRCFSQDAEFNMIVADSPRFALQEWVKLSQMIRLLSSDEMKRAETNGDLFVRETI
jgi:FkbM family methyltransferase